MIVWLQMIAEAEASAARANGAACSTHTAFARLIAAAVAAAVIRVAKI